MWRFVWVLWTSTRKDQGTWQGVYWNIWALLLPPFIWVFLFCFNNYIWYWTSNLSQCIPIFRFLLGNKEVFDMFCECQHLTQQEIFLALRQYLPIVEGSSWSKVIFWLSLVLDLGVVHNEKISIDFWPNQANLCYFRCYFRQMRMCLCLPSIRVPQANF